MKESGYKSYEDLPLFLNAATVAKVLGVSPSSGYELMLVVAKSTPLHPAYMPGIRSAPLLLLSPPRGARRGPLSVLPKEKWAVHGLKRKVCGALRCSGPPR